MVTGCPHRGSAHRCCPARCGAATLRGVTVNDCLEVQPPPPRRSIFPVHQERTALPGAPGMRPIVVLHEQSGADSVDHREYPDAERNGTMRGIHRCTELQS